MEDENQRRTWEYLQGMTRKDGSYGKILSDAFVAVLDRQILDRNDKAVRDPAISLEHNTDIFWKMLDRRLEQKFYEILQELQKILAEQVSDSFSQYVSAVHSDAEKLIEKI